MKKMTRVLTILLAILLIPLAVQASAMPTPHPDPYSGDLRQYNGKWIIDGQTEENTPWTLEISDGEYHLYNEYNYYEGDIIFTPGNEQIDRSDILWLDFDPDVDIEVVLINQAGGLIDVSGQGLFFVKPGNHIEFDDVEDLEAYSKKDMIGDWVLDKMYVLIMQYDFYQEWTNEDIMAGSITGDDRLILSFDKGILYQVSEKLEIRVPITYYRHTGRYYYFENPNPLSPYVYKFYANVVNNESVFAQPGQLLVDPGPIPEMDDGAELMIYLVFSRITNDDLSEGETEP